MLQQVTADVQPRLAAQVNSTVSLDRTRMVNIPSSHHFLFCSWYLTKRILHTCGRRSCRPVRFSSSSTHSQISERCFATTLWVSSSITTGHCVNKDVDPKRLGCENNAMKEAQQAHTQWHRWHIVAAALAVASCTLIFHETIILRLSEIRPIPWFLTEQLEVLVDPSTCTNLNEVEPRTNDRDFLSILFDSV